MNWTAIYLGCFIVGFVMSVLAVLGGAHVPLRLHLPHFMHLPHLHSAFGAHGSAAAGLAHGPGGVAAHGAAGHASLAHSSESGGAARAAAHSTHFSFFNFGTLMIFLAWFGGVGYLLTSYRRLAWLAVLGCAVSSGLTGAAIVFWFVVKVLLGHEHDLEAGDYQWEGVLGRVIVGIRSGGTGEIVFTQAGTRHAAGARSEDGSPIARGTEVVVTRYEKGIAYVRRWQDLLSEEAGHADTQARQQGV